jgi:hypothetical protein
MEVISGVIDFELGKLDNREVIKLFQDLLDNDLIKELQGHYQRRLVQLVKDGLVYHEVYSKSMGLTREKVRENVEDAIKRLEE